MFLNNECENCKYSDRLRSVECLECDKKTKPIDLKPYNYKPKEGKKCQH